jgi:hypothetical protein
MPLYSLPFSVLSLCLEHYSDSICDRCRSSPRSTLTSAPSSPSCPQPSSCSSQPWNPPAGAPPVAQPCRSFSHDRGRGTPDHLRAPLSSSARLGLLPPAHIQQELRSSPWRLLGPRPTPCASSSLLAQLSARQCPLLLQFAEAPHSRRPAQPQQASDLPVRVLPITPRFPAPASRALELAMDAGCRCPSLARACLRSFRAASRRSTRPGDRAPPLLAGLAVYVITVLGSLTIVALLFPAAP